MAAINNIEIFGLVCKETNPPVINIKRGKDKQAQIMTITSPIRNVSIQSSILSSIADVFAALTMFYIANNPTQSV
jgi:hypothetical protein